MDLNDLLGDSLQSLGLKQAQKQTLGAMKTQAPPPQRQMPTGVAPMSPGPSMFGTPGPGPAAPRNDFDPFAAMASPQMGMRPPMGAPAPMGVPVHASSAGGLDDLLGGMNLGTRHTNSGNSLAGMAQQQPKSQNGLDALDGFFGARPAPPQQAAAPAMQAADPFAAIGRPPAAVAAPATPAPARAAVGGIDDFGGFFAGSAAPASQPAAKPAAVAPPPQAAAPARPAADDFDVFARGGGEAAPPPPQQPQPSAAPVAPVLSPPPSPAAPDFDFFSGGAPAAAPATPAVQQPAFDDLDALGSIGGGNVKKAQSSDPLDNIMGWGAAPAQTHAQPVVAPRAHGAQPDLFGSHVSAAQVAAVQQATAGDLFDKDDEAPVDPNEPEERKALRLKRMELKKARVAEALRDKLELDARQQAEQEEKHQLADVVGVRLEAWQRMGKGNIRAYLTTVQDVLWEGNTWKPITMMDIVSTDQVQRAWKKVLINIHPDKVQQKGGTVAQRYISDKVFHVMLDAYNVFKQKEGLA